MENAFNVFALFSPENISSTFLLPLHINQIYLAIQCDFSLSFLKKEYLGYVKLQKCSTESMRV